MAANTGALTLPYAVTPAAAAQANPPNSGTLTVPYAVTPQAGPANVGAVTVPYAVTVSFGPASLGTLTVPYAVTPSTGPRNTGSVGVPYAVTPASSSPAGLYRRTGLATAVRPRLFRRTGLTSAVEVGADAQPSGPQGAWSLAFEDTFDGTTLDTSKWVNLAGTRMNDADTIASNVSVSGGAVRLKMSSVTPGAAVGAYIGTNRNSVEGEGFLLKRGMFVEFDIEFPGDGTQYLGWAAAWTAGGGYPASGENKPSHGENDVAEVLGAGVLNHVFHGPNGQVGPYAVPGGYKAGRRLLGMLRGSTSSVFYADGAKTSTIPTDDDGGGQSILLNIGYASPDYGGKNLAGDAGALVVYSVRAWTPA